METLHVHEDACNYVQNTPKSWRLYLKRCRRWVRNNWTWEVLCYTVSVLLLTILIVVLACFDGKPRSDRPSDTTLNALIAFGFTGVKGLMIISVSSCIGQCKYITSGNSRLIDVETYNEASQGIIGAFWLLLKPRVVKAAFLGACIVIAAVAIDPSGQQLVEYPKRSVAVSQDATLNIAVSINEDQFLSRGKFFEEAEFAKDGSRESVLKYNLLPLASSWRFTADGLETQPADAGYFCPSSHCEWPEYLTLGACSECTDMTKHLQVKNIDWQISPPRKHPMVYRAFLPNGHTLKFDLHTRIDAMNISAAQLPAVTELDLLDSRLLDFSKIWLHKWRRDTWKASHCSLSLCVQRRKAFLRNGHFHDRLLSTKELPLNCAYHVPNFPWQLDPLNRTQWCIIEYSDPPIQFDWSDGLTAHNARPRSGETIFEPLFFLNRSTNLAGWTWDRLLSNHNQQRAGTSFPVRPENLRKWKEYLQNQFNVQSERYSSRGERGWTVKHSSAAAAELFGENERVVLREVAKHITRILRDDTKWPSTANGTVYQEEVFVKVIWAWLTLPVVLLSCTLVVLLYTIWETKRLKIKPWKSSTLPLLIDGLEFSNETDYLVDISESEERAKATPLRLHQLWRFISGG